MRISSRMSHSAATARQSHSISPGARCLQEVVETGDLEAFRAWCVADRVQAQEQMANMEMLMGADDMEQGVVDSICADYHRLTAGTTAAGGQVHI